MVFEVTKGVMTCRTLFVASKFFVIYACEEESSCSEFWKTFIIHVLMVVNNFWNITLCSSVDGYKYLRILIPVYEQRPMPEYVISQGKQFVKM
jgi:hypothetical protein